MKLLPAIACCISAAGAMAQTVPRDTVYTLEEQVVRVARAKDYNAGNPTRALPLRGFGTVADMLAGTNAVFVKQYGQGLLATSSVRGLSASQVAVLWNGLSIQSPMNGVYDFNLLPTFFIDNASIEYGGSSAIYGNGALGGAISLNNGAISPNKLAIINETGSFGLSTQGVKVSYGNRIFAGQTKIFRSAANNNYTYNDYFQLGKPLVRQQHSHYLQSGLMQEFTLRAGRNGMLAARFWYNAADRELPPSIGASNQAQEAQYDDAYRSLISYAYSKGNWTVNNRNAFFREAINYYNINLPTSYSIAKTAISETDVGYKVNPRHDLLMGLNETWYTAKSDGYSDWPQQYMTSVYGAWKYHSMSQKVSGTVNVREILVNGKMKPATGSAGIDWQCLPKLLWQANAASSYRIPTFNDLYWSMGGNPLLKPEQGMKQETGLRFKHRQVTAEGHVFRNAVDNWIIWLPTAGGNVWSPQNIRYVVSRGAEGMLKYRYSRNTLVFSAETHYQYTRSENRKVEKGNEEIQNKQLIYVPMHTASLSTSLAYRSWWCRIDNTYTGKRFTSTDNGQFLPGFFLLNLQAARSLVTPHFRSELVLKINNCLNHRYEVVERKPMPGINYSVSLRIDLDFNSNNNIIKP